MPEWWWRWRRDPILERIEDKVETAVAILKRLEDASTGESRLRAGIQQLQQDDQRLGAAQETK